MGKYFGTDGFRGEANIDLTVEPVSYTHLDVYKRQIMNYLKMFNRPCVMPVKRKTVCLENRHYLY